jgi:hypothetical protein
MIVFKFLLVWCGISLLLGWIWARTIGRLNR